MGLTTDDILYEWRIGDGYIANEYKTAKKFARELKDRGNDIIIALTHMGLSKDKKLAKKVPEIDLIVECHSHDELHNVVWQKSKGSHPHCSSGKTCPMARRLVINYNKKINVLI